MITIKNIHFTLLVRIKNRLHEVNFRKRLDETYDADTGDDRGNRYYFKTWFNENEGHLEGSNLPGWIIEHKAAILQALAEKVKS